jgi:hypothetical protein
MRLSPMKLKRKLFLQIDNAYFGFYVHYHYSFFVFGFNWYSLHLHICYGHFTFVDFSYIRKRFLMLCSFTYEVTFHAYGLSYETTMFFT